MTDYDHLNKELRDAGVPEHEFMGNRLLPIDTLVNTNLSCKPFVDILLKYLPGLTGNEQEMLVRALTEKGNRRATPYLLDILKSSDRLSDNTLWAVGNALYTIDDPDSYPAILEICKKQELGSGRAMLLRTIARIKTEEVYRILVDCLTDSSVKGRAIEALGRLGNPKAIEVLEGTTVEKGKYEYKAKQTALKRLKRKS